MQKILVLLKKDCSGNQLDHNNDLPAIENKNYTIQKSFKIIFWHSNQQSETATGIYHLFGGPISHSILRSNIFFYVKLFATIILSWNLLKRILWYFLDLSDSFFKNENSVLPILIEKKFEQKINFVKVFLAIFLYFLTVWAINFYFLGN